ncbi:hypothetical protein PTHTG4_27120 [Parageobacillus thermoglucosidasius]|uniref:hypothetical protein n=1 Tax=Parageobacillus thermoglucosidasius TaxID=1426 RepID=UPI000F61A771|nr:hypothetical protein [Parageobacillus thermoglucosidasius]GCD83648.1 hypothetical protein PTHTG4_27120 [Parageobacillus thermoglucosidasius]
MEVTANRTTRASNTVSHQQVVVCKKCKSNQIVANKRGYSFKTMFLVLMSMIVMLVILVSIAIQFEDFLFDTGIDDILFIPIFIIILLGLPISILSGFIGRNTLVNGCMNCGYKWIPAKNK